MNIRILYARILLFDILVKPHPFILRLSAEHAWVRTTLTSIATALKAQLPTGSSAELGNATENPSSTGKNRRS